MARSHLDSVIVVEVLIIDDLGAGRALVDRLWFVGAVHFTYKMISTVSPFGRFEGLGSVPVPRNAASVEAPARNLVLDRLKEDAAVNRCRDVNIVCTSAKDALDKGVSVHLEGDGCLTLQVRKPTSQRKVAIDVSALLKSPRPESCMCSSAKAKEFGGISSALPKS